MAAAAPPPPSFEPHYPPIAPPAHKINLTPFYYGVVVVGSTAIVLALYNLIVVGFCAHYRRQRLFQPPRPNQSVDQPSQSFENSNAQLFSSFKYSTKETHEQQQQLSDNECSVCLSNFEEGEEVRQMPQCRHSFHAPCIDMWLYSHADCPLCRAVVFPPQSHNNLVLFAEDNSRVVLQDPSSSV